MSVVFIKHGVARMMQSFPEIKSFCFTAERLAEKNQRKISRLIRPG
jgi:hypothetical protein